MKPFSISLATATLSLAAACTAPAAIVIFEAAGSTPASITPVRDAFRAGIGGGSVAAANGDFGGLRREINWDGVPAGFSDPSALPGNFFNVNSPRGVVFSTPGTGFLVSTNAGDTNPVLFGFPNDLQTFSAQKLFTAAGSNITDVSFFVPGTTTPATTSAFGVIFTDVEVSDSTKLEFFDASNTLLFSRTALISGNQGLSFLGGMANAGELISRVRITAGANSILSNGVTGNPNDDLVAMDDFIYATPTEVPTTAVPESGSGLALLGFALAGLAAASRRLR
jgi:hypothetical protein